MTYFAPYVDESGLHLPTYDDILQKRIADARAIFGEDIYLGNDSADYQLIAVESLALFELVQAIQLAYNQMSPVTAVGTGLSSIVMFNGITRKPATYSTCQVVLSGTTSSTIINGEVVDVSGKKWTLPTPITLQYSASPVGYFATVTAVCQTAGPVNALPGDINQIATPTAGWTGVTNVAPAVVGQDVESDADLRLRQALSTEKPSLTTLEGTVSAIASVSGVTKFKVYENPTSALSLNFDSEPAHSITAIVEGGTDQDVAEAIYKNRGLGCYVNGTTVVPFTDTYGDVTPIRFIRPVYVSIYVSIVVTPLTGFDVPGDYDLIKSAIVNYLNSLEIGDDVPMSSIIASALSVISNLSRPTFSIKTIEIGRTPAVEHIESISLDYKEVAYGELTNISVTS